MCKRCKAEFAEYGDVKEHCGTCGQGEGEGRVGVSTEGGRNVENGEFSGFASASEGCALTRRPSDPAGSEQSDGKGVAIDGEGDRDEH